MSSLPCAANSAASHHSRIRLSETTAGDAAGWVEYCNGDARSKWGKIRADRGQPKPYDVKTWFLGNELYFFGRGGMNDPNNCGAQSETFAAAVRKTDPSIRLIGCTNLVGGNNNAGWNTPLLAAVGGLIDGISFHDYMRDSRKPGNLEGIRHGIHHLSLAGAAKVSRGIGAACFVR